MRKADWIATQLDINADDVMDVLLGNISKPRSFVDEVLSLGEEYDDELRRRAGSPRYQDELDVEGTPKG